MKTRLSQIGTCLALAAGLLLVAGAAWAQAIKTPISLYGTGCTVLPPSQQEDRRIWTDEDGIRHVRNQKYRCRTRGDINGRTVGYDNYNYDPATGHVDSHGYEVFTGTLLGEPAAAIGRWTNECEDYGGSIMCHEEAVYHFDNGSKAYISADYELFTPPPIEYTGVLLDPPGRN
jgi:hypothetical protein